MRQNFEITRKAGIELSVYEINHHTTQGDAPAEPRNRIVTSIAGGLNVANCMLQMLKDYGCRTQCLFSLVQHSYNAHNVGRVHLWGTALNMRNGHERCCASRDARSREKRKPGSWPPNALRPTMNSRPEPRRSHSGTAPSRASARVNA